MGDLRAILTSANLTESALLRNHEFGFVAEGQSIVSGCRQYFDDLSARGGEDLSEPRIAGWADRIEVRRASGSPPWAAKLGDEGADAGISPAPIGADGWVKEAQQSFVKFFGHSAGNNRADRSMPVLDEVESSGCHWACTYPMRQRPRQVRDGAIMFMGRLVKDPDDILIYGRAIGMRHQPGRDDATPDEIQRRPWKAKWPKYVRVSQATFIAGPLSNGVSLFEMMHELGSQSFVPTQNNAANGAGNTDPRNAYRRKPAVQLTTLAMDWMNERLERALLRHGALPVADLEQLDWPGITS